MEPVITKMDNGVEVYWTRYSKSELERFWNINGQGHTESRNRTNYCVVVPCINKEVALRLHAKALRKFAVPTCGHWDGFTFSFYCGDTGHTDVGKLMMNLANMFWNEIIYGEYDDPIYGKLFAEE